MDVDGDRGSVVGQDIFLEFIGDVLVVASRVAVLDVDGVGGMQSEALTREDAHKQY